MISIAIKLESELIRTESSGDDKDQQPKYIKCVLYTGYSKS